MRVLAVINPISGGKDKGLFLKYLHDACEKYGIDLAEFATTGDLQPDSNNFCQALSDNRPDRILSIGGDGTTIFTAMQLIGSDIPMGIIPFGSANGMTTELSIPQDPKLALDDFLKSRLVKKLDLIKVNDKHFCLHIGDVGLNAQVVEGFSKDQNRGLITYIKHFFNELQNAQQIDFEITADGNSHVYTGYLLAIANARKYGIGAILNKQGNPFDGKFELVIGLRKDLGSLISLGLTRFSEEIDMEDIVEIIQCKKAEIKLKNPHTLQLDGEVIGKTDIIKAEIVPAAVPLILQKENSQFIK